MSASRVTSATTGSARPPAAAISAGERVEPIARARADDERRAVAREPQRRRAPDAGRGAGDRDDSHWQTWCTENSLGKAEVRFGDCGEGEESTAEDAEDAEKENPGTAGTWHLKHVASRSGHPTAARARRRSTPSTRRSCRARPARREIADVVAAEMRRDRARRRDRRRVAPGRPNVVGVLEGRAAGRTLMFCGHTRHGRRERAWTQPVHARRARRPAVRPRRAGHEGRRRGDDRRRARDRRSAAVSTPGAWSSPRVVDEEHSSIGADALVTAWTRRRGRRHRADRRSTIAVGHKGFAWVEIDVHGKAAHGSRPAEGRGRDPADGPRAAAPRGARSRRCRRGRRIRWSAPRRCTRRSSRAAAS